MKIPSVLLLFVWAAVSLAYAQQGQSPAVTGYVTRVTSATDFDVNGIHVVCDGRTLTSTGNTGTLGCPPDAPFLGQRMSIVGSLHTKNHDVQAEEIQEEPLSTGEVAGSAVIDAAPDASALRSGILFVRADGYRIRLSSNTLITWTAPLRDLGDVKAGDWIDFKGKRNQDGSVSASTASLLHPAVGKGEEHLRSKTDFDPSTVPESAKQSGLSVAFEGINPKRFPAYDNLAMQTRVTEIGEKLVPKYQREFPDSDPAKIHFRFQVVESKIWWDALALPSGVILVPYQVVERLQNNSQLAAVLADNIATVLERQTYRTLPAARSLTAVYWASVIGGAFVPGLGVAGTAADFGGGEAMMIRTEEQSGRVALCLLHDAGYDLGQAPVAWWLLGKKKAEPIEEISLPRRAAYLYEILGENWRNPAITAAGF